MIHHKTIGGDVNYIFMRTPSRTTNSAPPPQTSACIDALSDVSRLSKKGGRFALCWTPPCTGRPSHHTPRHEFVVSSVARRLRMREERAARRHRATRLGVFCNWGKRNSTLFKNHKEKTRTEMHAHHSLTTVGPSAKIKMESLQI